MMCYFMFLFPGLYKNSPLLISLISGRLLATLSSSDALPSTSCPSASRASRTIRTPRTRGTTRASASTRRTAASRTWSCRGATTSTSTTSSSRTRPRCQRRRSTWCASTRSTRGTAAASTRTWRTTRIRRCWSGFWNSSELKSLAQIWQEFHAEMQIFRKFPEIRKIQIERKNFRKS